MDSKDLLLISQRVGLDEEGVLRQFEAFKEKYPTGEMTKREFVEYCLEKDDTAEESLSEALFNIFDKDSSGSMDFSEYIMASRASKLKSLEDKLNWIFNVFDKDGGGTLDMKELQNIVHGLFCMAGIEAPEDILDARSEEMRAIIDIDGDGVLTKEEFIKHAMECEFVSDMLVVGFDDEDEDEDDEDFE